ncbi:hypothetical protein Pssp01_45280 [Pseudomonas sp. NBRC 100443]|nr:hypothetical protein Pssp01_45280 [Pseudomonas sp. NBRC 100443]
MGGGLVGGARGADGDIEVGVEALEDQLVGALLVHGDGCLGMKGPILGPLPGIGEWSFKFFLQQSIEGPDTRKKEPRA